MARLVLFLVMLDVVGCTNQSVYESLRTHRRSECLKSQPARVDECMEAVDKPYEQYRREREEGIGQE